MRAKIIVITSGYLHEFVRETLAEEDLDCDIQVLEYKNFYHATELYQEYEEQADGFMISGTALMTAVEKALPDHKKPIVSFEASAVGEYRLFLELFLENRWLDARRVLTDALIPLNEDATVDYFLHGMAPFRIKNRVLEWINGITLEEISGLEERITKRIIELWERKEIDCVICHYGSIIPILEEYGVPYRYSSPDRRDFLTYLKSLLSQIELRQLRENLNGVIAVAAVSEEGNAIPGEHLKEALRAIKNDFALDVIIQEEGGYYYIFTTLRVIERMTDRFRRCSIRFALKKYRINAFVGYGIGYNITIAKNNARDALKEAVFSKGCFVVDEEQKLMGPLDGESYFEVKVDASEKVFKTADRCKLSSITIQKILSIMEMTGSSQITQQNLAEHLGVTSRNAGRILGNLVKGGAASMVYTKSVTSKGRPVKVYELNLKA